MHVLVIGAGASGLCTLKHLLDAKLQVTVYEQSKELGGTWIYSDNVDRTEDGLDVHSSMYYNLLTNLPKEVSDFPGLPIPVQGKSYLTSEEMLNYIRYYAEHFNLIDKISYRHCVIRVTPYHKSQWEVIVKDFQNDKFFTKIFDAVIVCNGHYQTPNIPSIPGAESFTGKIIHSHYYRRRDVFKDQRVLVIGGAASGRDIALSIAKHAKHLTFSHHSPEPYKGKNFPTNISQKPDVKRMTEIGVEFIDDTIEEFDTVLYCTGFRTVFPFLSVDCELTTDSNYIRPLFKHTINIHKPTMAFIGLPFSVIALPTFDLQARFVIKHIQGLKTLPSQQEMLDDESRETEQRRRRGMKIRHSHNLNYRKVEYYAELASIADITPLASYYAAIHTVNSRRTNEDLVNYKNDIYRIIDDSNFIRVTDSVEYLNG